MRYLAEALTTTIAIQMRAVLLAAEGQFSDVKPTIALRTHVCVHAVPAAADHFEVELSDLVQNNLKLFSVVHNTTYKYQTTLSLDEMKDTLRTIQNVTQRMLGTPDNPKLKAGDGAMEPYFVCTHYEAPSPVTLDPPAPGKPGIQVRCDMATLDADPTGLVTNCTRNGTVREEGVYTSGCMSICDHGSS